MRFFKHEKSKFTDFLYDSSIELIDRCFVVFSIGMIFSFIVSVPCGIIMKEPISSTLTTLFASVLFFALVCYSYKTQKIKPIRITIAFLDVFLLLPGLYITNGGVFSGAPLWILLSFYYLLTITEGFFRVIMSALSVLILLSCWFLEFYLPEYVTRFSRWGSFFDCFAALVVDLAVILFMESFHNRLYKRENGIAEKRAKELGELNRAQNRFFSSMSHEIRTPINTILGMNEIILRQEDASDEIRKDARNIQSAGRLLLALINDILDVSKIEAGKMDIVPVNYSVSALLSEIVNMIWIKAEEKKLKFDVDIDPNVPESLYGDEIRIRQILINLLNNAVKYTKEGSLSLHIECEATGTNDILLTITVSDTGMGIKPEAMPHLFDTFKRVDEEKNRYIEGTGLGLSIVKQLVELMDGQISVNSVYSQGSSFTVTLKQGIASENCIGDLNIKGISAVSDKSVFEHSFHAPDAKLLIVDDNEMNLLVEKKLLDGTDIKVDLAISGYEALTLAQRNRYDVIFLDHLMPEMDGIECYKKIRKLKNGLNTATPVIVLTANAGAENIGLYNSSGFDDYLLKPVSGRMLEEMLLLHLPQEKVIKRNTIETAGSSISTSGRYSRKKAVIVTCGSMSDLPKYIRDELDIDIIPSTVSTSEGVFYDNIDIDSEEILSYMKDEQGFVSSDAPTEDDYINFFSEELKKAHNVIFITMSRSNSYEYERATKAAGVFENVWIVNSESVSSATGILAMVAARLAEKNTPVEKIVSELSEIKDNLNCSFVIRTTDVMARRKRISPVMNSILNMFWLRPMLKTKNDKLAVGRLFLGSVKKCYEKYISKAFPANRAPDTSFVFVTYAGMEEEELLWIEEKINKQKNFDHVVFQKASAGITTNCGGGSFGIIYMTRGREDYDLGTLFDRGEQADAEMEIHGDQERKSVTAASEEMDAGVQAAEGEKPAEEKWYEKLDGIDAAAAIKNSGSEGAFKSVLKIFYDSIPQKTDELESFYTGEDWENYTIKVHALKSSAKLIGAMELSDAARMLENAGKEEDIRYIREHHDALMKEYKSFETLLSDAFPKKDAPVQNDSDITPEDEAQLQSLYESIRGAADEMDCNMLEDLVLKLEECAIPQPEKNTVIKIRECVDNFDYDGILEILAARIDD